MIEKPDLADAVLAHSVASAWGLEVTGIAFVPLGLDGWAYRVNSATGGYFLKVRRQRPGRAAMQVPRFLNDRGVTQAVAPLCTVDGRLSAFAYGYCLLLYPAIDGDGLWDRGLSDGQWIEYGRILAAVHGSASADLGLPVEDFATSAPDRIDVLFQAAAEHPRLRELWAGHCSEVRQLAERTRRLAERAADVGADTVLCHGDIHPGNLLAVGDGPLHVVDWDAPLLAPRECDLMFVFSGQFGSHPVNPHRESLFRAGYGPLVLDRTLMAYYTTERRLDDVALFVADVLDETLGEATRMDSLRWLRRILE